MAELTERAEEVLETLWSEIEEKGNKFPALGIMEHDEVIRELQEKGCIVLADHHIQLTEPGHEEAKNCVRRHRLAERLLTDVLHYKNQLVHDASCKLEHVLHRGLDDHICTLLGHPRTCPHGRPIPPGECCKNKIGEGMSAIMPLTELEPGKQARISYLQAKDRGSLQRFISMNLLPGTLIALEQKEPSYVFLVHHTRFAVDKEVASQIHVRIVDKK